MPGNFKDEDVRIQKTNESLMEAMSKLLDLRNFNKITVYDLCEEAQIGRSTFYSHFQDKYDLLKYWLTKTESSIIPEHSVYKDTKKIINDFVNNNGIIIRHLIEDANSETLGLVYDFMFSLLNIDKADNGQISPRYTVLSKFCCGGIMNYLQWSTTDKSITDSKIMNSYFYEILKTLYKWNKEHE